MSAESRELPNTRVVLYEGPTYADCLALLLRQVETMTREGRIFTILSIGPHIEQSDGQDMINMTVTFEE